METEFQDLIIANTKADVARRIAASTKLLEIEPTHPLPLRNLTAFKEKLQKSLKHSHNRLEVPEDKRQRAYGQLRDSSVELEGELDPAISSELENFDPLSTDDSQDSQEDSTHQDNSQEGSTHEDSGQESSTVDGDGDEL